MVTLYTSSVILQTQLTTVHSRSRFSHPSLACSPLSRALHIAVLRGVNPGDPPRHRVVTGFLEFWGLIQLEKNPGENAEKNPGELDLKTSVADGCLLFKLDFCQDFFPIESGPRFSCINPV